MTFESSQKQSIQLAGTNKTNGEHREYPAIGLLGNTIYVHEYDGRTSDIGEQTSKRNATG